MRFERLSCDPRVTTPSTQWPYLMIFVHCTNFTLLQFIEYYTILTKERCTKNNKEDVERKEDKRQGKLKKKEGALKEKNKARKKEDKLKMKKINPHAAYGNLLVLLSPES